MKYEKVEKGSFIIDKGHSWKRFYCILRGRVLVKFRNTISDKNENLMIYNPQANADNQSKFI